MASKGTQTLSLTGLRFDANLGILPQEQHAPQPIQVDTELNLGQLVYHQIFGEGVVLNFEGRGASARVQVNFDTDGSKWLVLQYANLQLM